MRSRSQDREIVQRTVAALIQYRLEIDRVSGTTLQIGDAAKLVVARAGAIASVRRFLDDFEITTIEASSKKELA